MLLTATKRDDLTIEYVAGGNLSDIQPIRQVLPQYSSHLDRDFGLDLWEKMLEDPAVRSAFGIRKAACLADGIRVLPSIQPPKPGQGDQAAVAEAQRASEEADFVRRCFDAIEASGVTMEDVCEALLDGLAIGNRIAEATLGWGSGRMSEWLVPKSIRPIHPRAFAYVTDEFSNVLGIIGAEPGPSGEKPKPGPIDGDPEKIKGFVPKEKFLIFRNGGLRPGPQGEPILLPAYNPWWAKRTIFPDYLKYLRQFATPSLIGTTPPDAPDEVILGEDGFPLEGPDGMPLTIKAATKMLAVLSSLTGNTVAVVPFGSKVDWLKSEGEGKAFLNADESYNRAIHTAILGTDGMTMAATNDSQGAKKVGQDVFHLFAARDKRNLSAVLTRFARWLILVNKGEEAVTYAPQVSVASSDREDRIERGKMYAAMKSAGLIHYTQVPAIMDEIGAPPVDPEVLKQEAEQAAENAALAEQELRNLRQPADPSDED